MNRLTEIANSINVDKGTECFEKHGYTEEYVNYIPETGEYNLLEIGIWHGDSLRMWNLYNNEMIVYGIDLDPTIYDYITQTEKIKIFLGNQSDPDFLKTVIDDAKIFDVIIDDGSHNYIDILTSFKNLYDSLAFGGHYFIEDLHAAQSEGSVKVIKGILGWLENSNKEYKSCKLLCNNKLLLITK